LSAAGTDHTGDRRSDAPLPLPMLPLGERGTVVGVHGGRGFVRRLADMGILRGTELRLVRGAMGAPVIIEVRGCRVVVGRGMAHRVLVRPLR